MITLCIFAGCLVVVLSLWVLIELQRAGRSTKPLFFCIPLMLAWPIAIYLYGSSLLGYAVADRPSHIEVIYAFSDEKSGSVYVVGSVDRAYRFYVLKDDFSNTSKAAAMALQESLKGNRMILDLSSGHPNFYKLPPSNAEIKYPQT